MVFSRIVGTGSYLPRECVSNAMLAERVDTSDEWIRTRTGIRQRYFAAADERASDLALNAARSAIVAAGVEPSAIDLIIVATSTPDRMSATAEVRCGRLPRVRYPGSLQRIRLRAVRGRCDDPRRSSAVRVGRGR